MILVLDSDEDDGDEEEEAKSIKKSKPDDLSHELTSVVNTSADVLNVPVANTTTDATLAAAPVRLSKKRST